MSKTMGKECEECNDWCFYDDLIEGLCERCWAEEEERREKELPGDQRTVHFAADEDWGRGDR